MFVLCGDLKEKDEIKYSDKKSVNSKEIRMVIKMLKYFGYFVFGFIFPFLFVCLFVCCFCLFVCFVFTLQLQM